MTTNGEGGVPKTLDRFLELAAAKAAPVLESWDEARGIRRRNAQEVLHDLRQLVERARNAPEGYDTASTGSLDVRIHWEGEVEVVTVLIEVGEWDAWRAAEETPEQGSPA